MLFGSGAIREEISKQGNIITKQLNNIKDDIPYQSELEKEYNKLLDSNTKLKKQIGVLENSLLSLQETNEKLMEYIENIEEVKQSGGIKTEFYNGNNFNNYKPVRYEIKEIPAIKICKRVDKEVE